MYRDYKKVMYTVFRHIYFKKSKYQRSVIVTFPFWLYYLSYRLCKISNTCRCIPHDTIAISYPLQLSRGIKIRWTSKIKLDIFCLLLWCELLDVFLWVLISFPNTSNSMILVQFLITKTFRNGSYSLFDISNMNLMDGNL